MKKDMVRVFCVLAVAASKDRDARPHEQAKFFVRAAADAYAAALDRARFWSVRVEERVEQCDALHPVHQQVGLNSFGGPRASRSRDTDTEE